MAADFHYEYDQSLEAINEVVDEGSGNSFIGARKIRWNPDADFKFDVRRYYLKDDPNTGRPMEVPAKGVSLTDSGTRTLAETMVMYGYGDTIKLLESLSKRPTFVDSLATVTYHEKDSFISSLEEAYERIEKEKDVTGTKDLLDSIFDSEAG